MRPRSAGRPQLAAAIDAIVERLRGGGRLVYVGAGTSGRLAPVDAAECGPTFGVQPGDVVAMVAGGIGALRHGPGGGRGRRRGGRRRHRRARRRPEGRRRRPSQPAAARRTPGCRRVAAAWPVR